MSAEQLNLADVQGLFGLFRRVWRQHLLSNRPDQGNACGASCSSIWDWNELARRNTTRPRLLSVCCRRSVVLCRAMVWTEVNGRGTRRISSR